MPRCLNRRIAASLIAGLAAVAQSSGTAIAADAGLACAGEMTDLDGRASVRTQVVNGAAVSGAAEFTPMFHNTLSAEAPARLPDVLKPDGETPNSGAYPAAKLYYTYVVTPQGQHAVPAYRLRLEVPVWAGGEKTPAYVKVRVGAWAGGRLVAKRDISAIVGAPDVPIYPVDLQLRDFDTRSADPDVAGLAEALRQVDHVDVEIHEGSSDGPVRVRGTISLGAQHDRLLAVAGALRDAEAKARAGACGPPG